MENGFGRQKESGVGALRAGPEPEDVCRHPIVASSSRIWLEAR